nr:hypothetical protein GCM10020093_030510 [Planobispora longispora]
MPAQAFGLGGQPGAALLGQPVVAADAAVHDLLPVDGDEVLGLESVQGGVEGARAQPYPAAEISWTSVIIP